MVSSLSSARPDSCPRRQHGGTACTGSKKTGLRAGDFTCCLHEVRGENRWNRTDSGGKYSGCDSARGEKLEGSCGKRTGVWCVRSFLKNSDKI